MSRGVNDSSNTCSNNSYGSSNTNMIIVVEIIVGVIAAIVMGTETGIENHLLHVQQ